MKTRHKYALSTLVLIGCICVGGFVSVRQATRQQRRIERLETDLVNAREVIGLELQLLTKLDDNVKTLQQQQRARELHGKS